MQSVKGAWRRFLGFLEGGVEDDDDGGWDEREEIVDYAPERFYDDAGYDDGLELTGAPVRSERSKKKSSNVVDFDTGRSPEGQIMVMIIKPKEMQDATLICEHLQDMKICIVDMTNVERPTAQRIADYLGGVSYAIRGKIERIDNYIFVMAPEGVKINSDLTEELKTGGLFKSFR